MNLPEVLNVAIGLIALYVLLSAVGSSLIELLAKALRYREEILIVVINKLLTGVNDIPWHPFVLCWDRFVRECEKVAFFNILKDFFKWTTPDEGKLPSTGNQQEDDLNNAFIKKFWEHPKIQVLTSSIGDAPASISSETFTEVIIDIVIPKDMRNELPGSKVGLERRLSSIEGKVPKPLIENLKILAASQDIPLSSEGEAFWKPFQKHIHKWYEAGMENASEEYKRFTQKSLLVIGFLLALFLNADTIRVVYFLSVDPKLREEIVYFADNQLVEKDEPTVAGNATTQDEAETQPDNTEAKDPNREELKKELNNLKALSNLGFPIGWTGNRAYDFLPYTVDVVEKKVEPKQPESSEGDEKAPAPETESMDDTDPKSEHTVKTVKAYDLDLANVALKAMGLALTSVAISLGAPFWYNFLVMLLNFRKKGADLKLPGFNQIPDAANGEKKTKPGWAIAQGDVPLEIGRDMSTPHSGFDPRKAYWLAKCSQLAYDDESVIKNIVEKAWFLNTPKFWDSSQVGNGDTQVFTVSTQEYTIIAFRGTEPKVLNDILADVNLKQEAIAANGVGQMHQGFSAALDAVYSDLVEWLEETTFVRAGDETTVKPIYVTGHSLGGALATLCAARILNAQNPIKNSVSLYNYGCPMVGDSVFVDALNNKIRNQAFRVIHGNDIVPKVPLHSMGYCHVGESLTFLKPKGIVREVRSLTSFLNFAIEAVDDPKEASKDAIADHGMEYYVKRCHGLATGVEAQV